MLAAAGIDDLFEARDRRRRRRARAPAGQAGARHVPRRRARRSASSRRRRPCSRTRWPGSQAGRGGHFGYVVGVDRVGQARGAARARRRRRRRATWRSCSTIVIQHPAFAVEPWALRETELDLDALAQTESVFALSNGHIGLRGNLDEGEPYGLPGTYLDGFYEVAAAALRRGRATAIPRRARRSSTSPTARSSGCSSTTSRSTSATASCVSHERVLDLRAGVLRRTRRVDLADRHRRCASARPGWCRSPSARSPRSRTRSSRVDERVPRRRSSPSWSPTSRCRAPSADPRAGRGARRRRSSPRYYGAATTRARPRPPHRGERAADGGRDGPRDRRARTAPRRRLEAFADLARLTVTADARARQAAADRQVRSPTAGRAERSVPALRDQVAAALAEAHATPAGTGLLAEQRAYLDDFWERADVEIEGDAELQQAVRFALFHVLQAGARAEQRAIAAKGLTGPGYDGHTFWDTETFVLPVLTYTAPQAAADALRWRHADARAGARAGAAARARGRRVPVADDPRRGVLGLLAGRHRRVPHQRRHRRRGRPLPARRPATTTSSARSALELLVETARLWRSLGHHDAGGALPHRRRHRARRVQRDRRQQRLHEPDGAAEPARGRRRGRAPSATARARARRRRRRRRRAGATPPTRCVIPYDERARRPPAGRGLHRPRASGTSRRTTPEQYPLLLHFPYFDLYRKQVVKQADLVLALHLCGDAFTRRGEGARLRLLRAADRARLVAVGVHAGGRRGRGRPPRARLRLLRRGGADGPRRPRAQHPRRPPHRLAGRRLDRGGRRLRRHARPRRRAHLRPAAARGR